MILLFLSVLPSVNRLSTCTIKSVISSLDWICECFFCIPHLLYVICLYLFFIFWILAYTLWILTAEMPISQKTSGLELLYVFSYFSWYFPVVCTWHCIYCQVYTVHICLLPIKVLVSVTGWQALSHNEITSGIP